ncbi:MAG: hypothetical protein ABIR37_00065 [Candidatus Saccharimonadales bacterium]
MSPRKEERPTSLPVYEYLPPVTPAPQQAERPAEGASQFRFSPEAWSSFGESAKAHVSEQDQRRKEIDAAFLGVYGPKPAAHAIGAAPRRQIAAGPSRPSPAQLGSAEQKRQPKNNPQFTTVAEIQTPSKVTEFFGKHRTGAIIGALALSALAVTGASYAGKQSSSGETSATLNMQPLSKELKNDTFTDGTVLAVSSIATSQNLEAHIPVHLIETGHTAYVSIPIAQFKLPVPLTATRVYDAKSKNPAVWARLNKKENQYAVDRGAYTLVTKSWIEQLRPAQTGTLTADQVEALTLTNIAKIILPAASPRQALIVDGQPAEWSKYPDATYPMVILNDSTNPKAPKYSYDTDFLRELVDRMQVKTLEALEDPAVCSKVLPALDTANITALSQQNSIGKNVKLTVDQKTSYGKASEAFKNDVNVKKALGRNAVSIEQFTLSCPTDPVIAKPATSATTSSSKSTAPAKK